MPALTRSVEASSTELLLRILEQPQLLAAVRELPAPVLARLIDHVGLEDAGELIALTSTEQLEQVFDADLWRVDEQGAESFRPERFGLWLRMMHEAGEAFVVERLVALPRELLCLAVHRLVLVLNVDVLAERIGSAPRYDTDVDAIEKALDDAPYEEWEEFRLIAREPGVWDEVWSALLSLDAEHHELLREILERCCDLSGELIDEQGLYDVLTLAETLESDVAAERSDRRAARGFVSPADARSFLQLAVAEPEASALDGRDPITRAYFRELAAAPAPAGREHDQLGSGSSPAALASTRTPAPDAQPDVGGLLELLRAARVTDGTGRSVEKGRLAAGRMAAEPTSADARAAAPEALTLMAATMADLQATDPALHAERMEELGYLANVVIAGASQAGRSYRPVEAIECALAACSVGLERASAGRRDHTGSSAARPLDALIELSADRLFRAGLRALTIELGLPVSAVLARLAVTTRAEPARSPAPEPTRSSRSRAKRARGA